MEMLNFNSGLRLTDYSPTHNQVLFRGLHIIENNEHQNLDVIFERVELMHCPTFMKNAKQIYRLDKNLQSSKLPSIYQGSVFEILCDENSYYIIAGRVIYQYNDYPEGQTSIPCKLEADIDTERIIEQVLNNTYKPKGPEWHVLG